MTIGFFVVGFLAICSSFLVVVYDGPSNPPKDYTDDIRRYGLGLNLTTELYFYTYDWGYGLNFRLFGFGFELARVG